MFAWITENFATLIVATILFAVCTLIIIKLWRDRKKGKNSCGCGCAGCAMSGICHPQNKNKK